MSMAPDGFVWCGRKGDLSLYLTHINEYRDGGGEDAALYIRNENRRVDTIHPLTGEAVTGCPAFVVPFQDFWKFRPEGRDSMLAGQWDDASATLGSAAVALYGLDAPMYRHRIHDAIMEFADDVKNQRPPPEKTRAQWLAEMQAAGFKIKMDGQELH